VFNISKRILIDYYRKAKQETISLDVNHGEDDNTNINYLLSISQVKTSTPHLDMVSKEELFKAQRAIARLPKKYRRVSNLFFNHHYMLKEIAERCDMPIGTVKGDIHKARKILQNKLERF
jgi:RNA polymerase sigma-70 factor (ECF subfamily)